MFAPNKPKTGGKGKLMLADPRVLKSTCIATNPNLFGAVRVGGYTVLCSTSESLQADNDKIGHPNHLACGFFGLHRLAKVGCTGCIPCSRNTNKKAAQGFR